MTMGFRALGTEFVSADKRFEVDGAIAARDFVQQEARRKWSPHRLQLIWDSIALHTNLDIARYKEPEVALVSAGTFTELVGPEIAAQPENFGALITVTQDEWDRIAGEFPRDKLKFYVRDVFTGLCALKPERTYNNLAGDYGEEFLEGYTREGHRVVDLLESTLPE